LEGSSANEVDTYEAARFKPPGWSWIDPTKEVAAYKEAALKRILLECVQCNY
jgi:capsid protein